MIDRIGKITRKTNKYILAALTKLKRFDIMQIYEMQYIAEIIY